MKALMGVKKTHSEEFVFPTNGFALNQNLLLNSGRKKSHFKIKLHKSS